MVSVAHFRKYDAMTDSYITPPMKSTLARIREVGGGEVIPGTIEDVDPSALDPYGRYNSTIPPSGKS